MYSDYNNPECFMAKKLSLFPFNTVAKYKKAYPDQADYRCSEVIFCS